MEERGDRFEREQENPPHDNVIVRISVKEHLFDLRWNLKNLSRGLNLPKPGLN